MESMLALAFRCSDKQELISYEFDLLSTLAYALDMAKLHAPYKKLKFTFDWLNEELHYKGTRSYILQIVTLLLSNAVKFTDTGGSVTLRLRKGETHIDCSVIDTGIGLNEEELGRILTHNDLPHRMIVGRGPVLGLARATQLAQIIKGDLTATSERGAGSSFCLRLPLLN